MTIRERSSNRKGKGDHGRSKSRSTLKKNQCAFYKEEGHEKVDCPKLKNKESKPEANIAQVKSSQVDGLNSESLVVSLTITTPTTFYSDISKWILNTRATYHVCPKRECFVSSKNLEGGGSTDR